MGVIASREELAVQLLMKLEAIMLGLHAFDPAAQGSISASFDNLREYLDTDKDEE